MLATELRVPLVCIFCGWDEPKQEGDQHQCWLACPRCGARGPSIERTVANSDQQAIAGWNKPHSRIGDVAVSTIPAGIPGHTMSLAMRLRLIAEGMQRGEYGGPDGALILLREGKRVHIVNHNVADSSIEPILRASAGSISVRRRLPPPPRRGG